MVGQNTSPPQGNKGYLNEIFLQELVIRLILQSG